MAMNAIIASVPVTAKLAVAEPMYGIRPKALLKKMKKNSVQKNGVNLSQSWAPMFGRTIKSRTMANNHSMKLSQRLAGGLSDDIRRENGMNIKRISATAANSSSINLLSPNGTLKPVAPVVNISQNFAST